MPSYDASISITASPDAVWRVLSDVVHWPQWLPTMTSVDPLDTPSLRTGAKYRIVQPRLRPATWVVTAVEPPTRFAWEVRSPGVRIVADHIVNEPSPGTSHVVLRITTSGVLGAPIGLLTRSIAKDYLAQEAAALKRKVEGTSALEG